MKRMITLLLILSTALSGVLCACGDPPQVQNSPASSTAQAPTETTTAVDPTAQGKLEQLADKYGFVGVLTVCCGGKRIAAVATGIADAATDEKTTVDSLFCIGSLSKQFAAAAVMLLQERGKLSVEDTLDRYFPDCPYGSKVTLRQMLKMRSGIAEFYDVIPDGHNNNELPVGTLRGKVTNDNTKEQNRELLQRWLFEQPLDFTPGSEVAYCNSNYFLLAQIVEKVSGMPYEDFLRQNIFEPLGMDSTGFIDEMLDDPRLAKNAHEAQTVYVGITMGLGDMISNAADMERWMSSFFGNDLLTRESIDSMTLPDAYSGYGFGVVPAGGGSWYHSGIFTSYSSFDYVDPQKRLTVFASTNNQSSLTESLSDLCSEILTTI